MSTKHPGSSECGNSSFIKCISSGEGSPEFSTHRYTFSSNMIIISNQIRFDFMFILYVYHAHFKFTCFVFCAFFVPVNPAFIQPGPRTPCPHCKVTSPCTWRARETPPHFTRNLDLPLQGILQITQFTWSPGGSQALHYPRVGN